MTSKEIATRAGGDMAMQCTLLALVEMVASTYDDPAVAKASMHTYAQELTKVVQSSSVPNDLDKITRLEARRIITMLFTGKDSRKELD